MKTFREYLAEEKVPVFALVVDKETEDKISDFLMKKFNIKLSKLFPRRIKDKNIKSEFLEKLEASAPFSRKIMDYVNRKDDFKIWETPNDIKAIQFLLKYGLRNVGSREAKHNHSQYIAAKVGRLLQMYP